MGKVILLIMLVGMLWGWGKNIVKLSECDFKAPYKCEVIHVVGLVPVIGAVTGWMDVGK